MIALTRRGAMLGAGAAVAVAGVPTAVASKPEIVDLLVAAERRMLALQASLDGGQVPEGAQWDALFEEWDALQDRIAETPATTVQGLAVKLRLIDYTNREHDMDAVFGLALIKSTIESAERLSEEGSS